MNKKGFTLVELLAVVIIVSLLVIIALPLITNSVKNFSGKTDALMLEMIEEAAKLYIEDNPDSLKKTEEGYYCVPLTELINNNYLKEGIEISGKHVTNSKSLKINYKENNKIELVDSNKCVTNPLPDIQDPNESEPSVLAAGLYDENDVLLASWDELLEAGFDVEISSKSLKNSLVLSSYGESLKLIIDDSITNIGRYAFYYCHELTSVTIPESVTNIGLYSFEYCYRLENIIVHENNSVYDSRNNSNAIIETATNTLIVGAKNTIIPSSVTSIGSYAFNGSGLSSIRIPESIISISNKAFVNCDSLWSITVDKNNSVYDSRDNSNAIIETASNTLIVGGYATTIPSSIISIGSYAFNGSSIESITIPTNITRIEEGAFYSCHSLSSITIPSSVTSIEDYVFEDCKLLTNIEIPDSVTSIGKGAFDGCYNLESIKIPASVTSIGDDAFAYCGELASIIVDENNSVYDSRENSNAIIETSTNTLIVGGKNTIIPSSVTSIGRRSFVGRHLTSIIIPEGVKSIGPASFFACTNLIEVTISSSVTSIDDSTFNTCDNLKTIYYSGPATGKPWGASNAKVISG